MTEKTKKGLIISGVVLLGSFIAYKLLFKKSYNNLTPTLQNNIGNSSNSTQVADNSNGNNINSNTKNNPTSLIGMMAVANGSGGSTNVFKDSSETYDYIYNNIIGVVNNGNSCGKIIGIVQSNNGTTWCNVQSTTNYNCPFLTCGLMLTSYNSGWVKLNDVIVK